VIGEPEAVFLKVPRKAAILIGILENPVGIEREDPPALSAFVIWS